MAAFSCEEYWSRNEEFWSETEENDSKIVDNEVVNIVDNEIETPKILNYCPFFMTPPFINNKSSDLVVDDKSLISFVDDDIFFDVVMSVPEAFEVKNGFGGMLRNICVELMCYSNSHDKIRAVVGMDEQIYFWTKKSYFKGKINSVIPKIVTDLSVQDANDVIIGEKTVSILKCSNHTGWTWAFLDKILESNMGVYSIFVRCVKPSFFNIALGIMAVSENHPFGDGSDETMYAKYQCHGELYQMGSSYGNHPWKENDIVGLELDTDLHTVRFSVNGCIQPVGYHSVPSRVRFSVCQLCRYANGYMSDDRGGGQSRYVRYGIEVFVFPSVQRRLMSRGDVMEFLAFTRCRSGAGPFAGWPVAAAYDPDHFGYKPRVVDWIYEGKRQRR